MSFYFKDAIHKNYESVHDLRLLNTLALISTEPL